MWSTCRNKQMSQPPKTLIGAIAERQGKLNKQAFFLLSFHSSLSLRGVSNHVSDGSDAGRSISASGSHRRSASLHSHSDKTQRVRVMKLHLTTLQVM